jgi:HK97 family phage portal protein
MKIPIISKLLDKRSVSAATVRRILSDEPILNTHSGITVTPDTSMRASAVWACVRVLSTSMAALPLHVYRDRPDGGKDKAKDNPVYDLLHRKPNPWQTSFVFRMVAMAHLCLWGNAYAEIEFDNFGQPVSLWLIPPWLCEPVISPSKELYYRVNLPGEVKNLPAYRVLHVMGLGTDGLKGLSPIRLHAETVGISLAATQFGASFFGSGTNIGGVVEHPMKLSDQGSEKLRKSINEKYAGLGKTHRIMLLEEGMKYQKIGIPPNEAQFIETLQFGVEDIARIYGVQLHKIGHLLRSTNNNIEHQGIEFVTDTILPWTVNWEMEYDSKLFFSGDLYTKHSLEGLLRGDTAARATFYKELFYLGSLCPDEIREKEDMNPLPDGSGKRYYIQANMTPADKVDDVIAKNGQTQAPARSLAETVKKLAERDKAKIKAAYQRDPEHFEKFVDDYYRDIEPHTLKEILDTE